MMGLMMVFDSCKPSGCPIQDSELERLFDSVAIYKTGGVHCSSDSLDLLWGEDISFLKFPFISATIAETLKANLPGRVTVGNIALNCLETQTITTAQGSMFVLSQKTGVLESNIVESTSLLGSEIKIGMSRRDFLKLFLHSDTDCFQKYNYIFFYGGMAENGLTFIFEKDKLIRIRYKNIPDGIPQDCQW